MEHSNDGISTYLVQLLTPHTRAGTSCGTRNRPQLNYTSNLNRTPTWLQLWSVTTWLVYCHTWAPLLNDLTNTLLYFLSHPLATH